MNEIDYQNYFFYYFFILILGLPFYNPYKSLHALHVDELLIIPHLLQHCFIGLLLL